LDDLNPNPNPNLHQEIMQAFMDYQTTQFGGWPWGSDGYVFDRKKGRFALQKGQEELPPNGGDIPSVDEL
jgi:quercetin 2,3-dioxygenase